MLCDLFARLLCCSDRSVARLDETVGTDASAGGEPCDCRPSGMRPDLLTSTWINSPSRARSLRRTRSAVAWWGTAETSRPYGRQCGGAVGKGGDDACSGGTRTSPARARTASVRPVVRAGGVRRRLWGGSAGAVVHLEHAQLQRAARAGGGDVTDLETFHGQTPFTTSRGQTQPPLATAFRSRPALVPTTGTIPCFLRAGGTVPPRSSRPLRFDDDLTGERPPGTTNCWHKLPTRIHPPLKTLPASSLLRARPAVAGRGAQN